MANIVLTVHLLLAFTLIVVVLLQRSEGGGLGMGGGGGGGIMTGRGAATALSKVTWVLGIAFVVTSLTLTILSARGTATGSVIDRLGTTAPASQPAGSAPDLGDDLLPPVPTVPVAPSTDGPATPPAADGPATPPAAD